MGVLHLGGFLHLGGLHPGGGVLHLGGFSIRRGSSIQGGLHLGGFSIWGEGFSIWGVLHPGGFLHLGGFSIRGGPPSWGVSIWGGSPLGGLHPGGFSIQGGWGIPCDLSYNAFDVTCMLPPHQLRYIYCAAAYIVWSRCMLGYIPPPPVDRITDTCKNITFPQLRLWAVKTLPCPKLRLRAGIRIVQCLILGFTGFNSP